ncbi:MAG: HAD family hydrolase [Clostridiales bacterium]|nr:HAD family hydrolase [Clostridiales bacterium]
MKYKMAVSDCDNTLIDKNGYLPQDNITAVRKIMERGVEFVIASGRNDLLFADFAKEIGGDISLIGCNGATIRNLNKNETLRIEPIPKEALCKIVDFMDKNGFDYKAYTIDRALTKGIEIGDKIRSLTGSYYKNKKDFPYEKIEGGSELKELEVLKIVAVYDTKTLSDIQSSLKSVKGVNVVFSSKICLDIVSEKASKGAALKFLAEKKGIKPEEIIAFGDTENDLSMLTAAGLSVCMKNGEESLKKLCHMTTERDNCEAGVAYTLNKIFDLGMY